MCPVITPPILILAFWIVFAAIVWPLQARSKTNKNQDTDKHTDNHNERIYKDYEFFVKAFLAIVGGFGYIRIEKYAGNEVLIREAMIGLAAIGLAVAATFGIFIICHQGSKLRRWPVIEWNKIFFWQENWMCLSMLGFASALWAVAHKW
jgi:hypothetical protein